MQLLRLKAAAKDELPYDGYRAVFCLCAALWGNEKMAMLGIAVCRKRCFRIAAEEIVLDCIDLCHRDDGLVGKACLGPACHPSGLDECGCAAARSVVGVA